MVDSGNISNKLGMIENYLQRIESKLDNFLGFEDISKQEEAELIEIKTEMSRGEFHLYSDIFK